RFATGASTESGPGMATSTRTSRPPQAASTRASVIKQRGTGNGVREGVFGPGKTRRVLGLLQLIPALLLAQQSSGIDSLFPARPTGYLTDVAGVVDQPSASRIDDLAARLRTATGAELAVVTLPTQGRYETSDLALALARQWGVGAKAEIGEQRRNARP